MCKKYNKMSISCRGVEQSHSEEFKIFFSKFDDILNNQIKILHDSELTGMPLTFAHAGTFLTGSRVLTLGHLMVLWSAGGWTQPCQKCGATSYVFEWGGSSASGKNCWNAWCPQCKQQISGSTGGHGEWILPAIHEIFTKNTLSFEYCFKKICTMCSL